MHRFSDGAGGAALWTRSGGIGRGDLLPGRKQQDRQRQAGDLALRIGDQSHAACNWGWGAAISGVLVLLGAPRGEGFWWRVVLSVLLAEIGSHSFAHGLAIWPVLFALVLLFDSASFLKRATAAGGILVIAGITIVSYFHDFINVAHHAYDLKPGDPAMKGASSLFEGDHLMQAVRFFFAFLGTWFARSPFVEHPLDTARILGIATLAVFVSASLIFIVRRRSRSQWRAAIPWLALAAYVCRGWMLSGIGIVGFWDLLRVPVFLLWKLVVIRFQPKPDSWIRTKREP